MSGHRGQRNACGPGDALVAWLSTAVGTCGFQNDPRERHRCAKATPEWMMPEAPGLSDQLLRDVRAPGGSLPEKMRRVLEAFRSSAHELECQQPLLRRRALERAQPCLSTGDDADAAYPLEVRTLLEDGTYTDGFLKRFDDRSFVVHASEIVPGHEYCLALEVSTGGKYWSNVSTGDEADTTRHSAETVNASSAGEGCESVLAQYGAAQRGAVFVWRWRKLEDLDDDLPEWLSRTLTGEGDDPVRKLQEALEAVRRWEHGIREDTAMHVKHPTELRDPYLREVLKLWPVGYTDYGEVLDTCAWVEGLDSSHFVGRKVALHRVRYDRDHALVLHAQISKRHADDEIPPQDGDAPYRLTTSWAWAPVSAKVDSRRKEVRRVLQPNDSPVAASPLGPKDVALAASPLGPKDTLLDAALEAALADGPLEPLCRSAIAAGA